MNLPNIISCSRIPILFGIVGLLYSKIEGASTMAFLLLIIAAFTDWLDGYLARRSKEVTEIGKVMDAITDKILILGLFCSLLTLGILPQWTVFFVLIIIVREFFITALRVLAASKGLVVAAEKEGKLKTVFQLISLLVLFSSLVIKYDVMTPEYLRLNEILYWIGISLFLMSVVLTIQSGYVYFKRYGKLFVN